eukprot:COSAG02_NODE_19287_length_890_cov_1.536030_1_plen_172_part_10
MKRKQSSNGCCGKWDLALDAVQEAKREIKKYQDDHKRKQRQTGFKEVFDLFDKDGSGDMDLEELAHAYFEVIEWLANKAAKRKPPPTGAAAKAKLQRLWKETDKNRDGRVTFEEFAKLCHRMMEGEDMLGEVDDTLWEKVQKRCRKVMFPHEEGFKPDEVKTMAKDMDALKD